jgi:hypothetical protein
MCSLSQTRSQQGEKKKEKGTRRDATRNGGVIRQCREQTNE